ncbi:SWI/SNF chromatin-remodeling complex subunit, partial [Coemansia nantahalensis]
RASVEKWQADATRITRSNEFKHRETAKYQAREAEYRAVLETQRQQNNDLAMAMRREREAEKLLLAQPLPWGPGYAGYGNGTALSAHQARQGVPLAANLQDAVVAGGAVAPQVAARLVAPVALVMPGQRRGPGGRQRLRFSRRQLQHQAEKREVLVPIRLDIDADGYRLRDTFTWDLGNELVSPEQFAQGLCADLAMPSEALVAAAVQSIEEQLDDFRRYGYVADEPSADLVCQTLRDEYRQAADDAADEATVPGSGAAAAGCDAEAPEASDPAEPDLGEPMEADLGEGKAAAPDEVLELDARDKLAWMDDELRVVIRLDIIIGHIALRDQLEWDVAPLLRPMLGGEQRAELERLARTDGAAFAAKAHEWAEGAAQGVAVSPERVARVL